MHRSGIWISLLLLLACTCLSAGCIHDCSWHGTAEAFIDSNANGTLDAGEPALRGVQFHVKDTSDNQDQLGIVKSGNEGKADLAFFITCTDKYDFFVSAALPAGYQPTTPLQIKAGSMQGQTFSFGFVKNK